MSNQMFLHNKSIKSFQIKNQLSKSVKLNVTYAFKKGANLHKINKVDQK